MPAKFALSSVKALTFDFDEAVAVYKQALADFYARPPEWDPTPAPIAQHPLVAVAASSPDGYVVYDDTPPPPPPPSLDERKAALAGEIQQRGQEAIHALVPPLKRPLFELRLAAARATPEANRTEPQRDIINNARGLSEQAEIINAKVAGLLDLIHEMDETAFDVFASKPLPELR